MRTGARADTSWARRRAYNSMCNQDEKDQEGTCREDSIRKWTELVEDCLLHPAEIKKKLEQAGSSVKRVSNRRIGRL